MIPSRKRWDAIFQSSKGPSDLKRALKFEDDSDNCDDTLRSVYWKVNDNGPTYGRLTADENEGIPTLQ